MNNREVRTKNSFLRARSLERKRRRANRIQRELNILRNQRRSRSYKDKHIEDRSSRVVNLHVDAKDSLSIFNKPDNIARIIRTLESHTKDISTIKNIKINLENITEIDIGGISLLLAKINEISKSLRVRIWGTSPNDLICRRVFDESGFLDYMTDLSGQKFEKRSDNYLFNVGSDKTANERVGKSIKSAMKYLTDREQHFQPVYSIIQEMCSNSVEWANSPGGKNKNWLLGINYSQYPHALLSENENGIEKNNRFVAFTLTDIGFGILNTIKRKFGTYIAETLKMTRDTEILNRAFERKYESRTGEANRNRGLPLIKDRSLNKYINDLKVVTNNVFLDFTNPSLSRILDKSIPGTFYYWTIDLNCIARWNQKNTNY
jgi:hypothetical protein